VIRDVEDLNTQASGKELQRIALKAIKTLLESSLIRAGFPRRGGSGFDAWDLPTDQIVERIKQDWNKLGQEPTIGDVVWFVSTTEGDRALAEGQERNVLKEPER